MNTESNNTGNYIPFFLNPNLRSGCTMASKCFESGALSRKMVISTIPHSECKTKGEERVEKVKKGLRLIQTLWPVQATHCKASNPQWHSVGITRGHVHTARTGSPPTPTHILTHIERRMWTVVTFSWVSPSSAIG